MAIGIVLIVLGIVEVFWAKKRSFDRTNSAGVEEFSGFGQMIASRSFEKVAQVGGLLLILVGIGNLAASFLA